MKKANGRADSYDLLARAMRVAFEDSVKRGLIPMEKRMNKRMDTVLMKTRKTVSNEIKSEIKKSETRIRKDIGDIVGKEVIRAFDKRLPTDAIWAGASRPKAWALTASLRRSSSERLRRLPRSPARSTRFSSCR